MASSSAALTALLVASCAAMAAATSFTVGDGKGWVAGFDYTSWTSGKSFKVDDVLVFNYAKGAHTVTEVSKTGYDSCSGANYLSNDNSGSTTVKLSTSGTHYFICNIPGHCADGMKLAVTVAGGGPGSPSTPSGGAIPAGSAGGALVPAVGPIVAAAAGALIKLALF